MIQPDFITALDHKPGDEWTSQEVARAQRWWMEREQERLIWSAAHRYLGPGVTPDDVEDAWVSFYSGLDRLRLSYRPGGPNFVTYAVHVCYKRECVRTGDRLRKQYRSSLSMVAAAAEEGSSDDEIVDDGGDPQKIVERDCLIKEVKEFLEQGSLPENHRKAFELKHMHEMSNEEIAAELGVTVGTAKVWAHRGAMKIQEHLTRKGWAN